MQNAARQSAINRFIFSSFVYLGYLYLSSSSLFLVPMNCLSVCASLKTQQRFACLRFYSLSLYKHYVCVYHILSLFTVCIVPQSHCAFSERPLYKEEICENPNLFYRQIVLLISYKEMSASGSTT